MATPQPGIFAMGTPSHYHLEYDLVAGAKDAAVAEAVRRRVEPEVTSGGANIVLGFGSALWSRLAGADRTPDGLVPFSPIGAAPATQHDLWVWIHGSRYDVTLDIARAITAAFGAVAVVAAEQPCFVYHDGRDLTGFIDGTENPHVEEARHVAVIAEDRSGAGGAFVLTQRWVHDLARFNALTIEEQERVFGRTKLDSVEIAPKPSTAHISRVVVEDEQGDEIEIYRRSTPYGTVGESGLYFVALSADPGRFTTMLNRMFGVGGDRVGGDRVGGDGVHDRLTEFSTPVSGALYFAPSVDELSRL